MRAPTTLLALMLASSAAGQVQDGDLLLNVWAGDVDVIHARPDGVAVRTFTSAGSLGQCEGAALTPDGRILTARWKPIDGLSLFDWDGTETELGVGGKLSNAGDVDVFPNGELLAVEQTGTVEAFAADGTHLRTYGAGLLAHPWGIHVDAEGTLWVADFSLDLLARFAQDGAHLTTLNLTYGPADVVRAPDGTLWTLDEGTGTLRQHAGDGTPLQTHPTAVGADASGIAMALDGTLLVSEWSAPAIHRYGQDGTFLETIPVPEAGAGGVLFMNVVGAVGGDVGDNYCGPANLNSSGGPGVIAATGTPFAAANFVELHATGLPPNEFGYFLNSMTTGFVPFPGGSQGNLCLGGGIGRYSDEVASTGAAGELHLVLDLTDTPTPNGPVVVQPGETWHFQGWFRDQNPGPTSNFTDGLTITFD